MPTAAPTYKSPGTKTLDQRRAEWDQRRGKTAARGYDGAWRKLSIEFRAQHPFCECDEHCGVNETALTEVVDHRIPISARPDLRLEWSNLRAMTKRCHDQHTARTQGFGRGRA